MVWRSSGHGNSGGLKTAASRRGSTADETRPRGRRFHTVSCQKLIRTYQFEELREN